MTRDEAKKELKPIKELTSDIRTVELEIERLMTLATKMTPNYEPMNVTSTPKNKIEEAVIKIDEYRSNLASMILDYLDYKNKCLNKIQRMETDSLRKILIMYYFQDCTFEQTAERLHRSYQWTYEMYTTALDEYCKVS